MTGKIETLNFSARRLWRAWLAKNHRTKKEVWLVYDKRFSQSRHFSYREFLADAVEEAICYGWIDSRAKRLGQTKIGVRLTPRRSRDNWLKYNRIRALMLFHNGLMTKAGIDVLPVDWTGKNRGRVRHPTQRLAECAAGILVKNGRFLVEKRSDNDEADPGFIEIPGGHLNRGETVKDALRRELKEELGINIEKARPVGTGLYTATNGERGRIHYSHVQKWNGRDRVQRG